MSKRPEIMRFLLHFSGLSFIPFWTKLQLQIEELCNLDFLAKIPNFNGKITYRRKDNVDYVYYEYDRIYDIIIQKTNPKGADYLLSLHCSLRI